MIIMRLSSCCTYFLIFSRLHRRTSPAAEVCSQSRTSLAAVACLQPSPHQSSRGSLQQKPHQPSGGSSQPLPQWQGGTARIMHRTGPAAVVRSHRCNSTACSNHHTSRSYCRTEPAAVVRSHCAPLRSSHDNSLPQKITAITTPVQRPKVCLRRTSPAADGVQPSPFRSSSSSLPPRGYWKGYAEFLIFFSYLLFLCSQLSFDRIYTSLTVQQKFAVLAAPVQPLMVCSLHRTSPAADGLQPSPHQSSHDSLRSSPQQSSRSSLQPSWHQSSRAIADPVQPPSFCLVFLSLMLLDYIYIYT